MRDKVLNALKKYDMIKSGGKVVAALSGGADSVAMTHCLYTLSKKLNFKLTVCHINHTLRGKESERDYRFVEDFCKKLNIPLVVFREDINALAKSTSQSTETAARERRYMRFAQCAYGENDRIATAHNLNDRAETLIYNMIRGSGIKGVGSIPPVRENIIRPLIDCTREEIEAYCKEHKLGFVTDSTNLTDDYTRNKIRHNVIPAIVEICPTALESMKRLSESASEDSEFIESIAENAVSRNSDGSYDAKSIKAQPTAVKKRIVKRILGDFGFEVSGVRINEVTEGIDRGSFKAEYAKGRYICCDGKRVFLKAKEDICEPFCIEVDTCGKYAAAGKSIALSAYTKEAFESLRITHKIDLKSFIDYDKIIGKVFLRQRQDGDSVKLWKRNGTKSLKKLFSEAALTQSQKSRTVLLCDDCGIVWIEGFGAAERVHADENSKNILLVEIGEQRGVKEI